MPRREPLVGKPWLWPDRTIGKRESRVLREDHNATVNSHADLLDACELAIAFFSKTGRNIDSTRAIFETLERAVANARQVQDGR